MLNLFRMATSEFSSAITLLDRPIRVTLSASSSTRSCGDFSDLATFSHDSEHPASHADAIVVLKFEWSRPAFAAPPAEAKGWAKAITC
ncbi:hypothetical protein QTI33_08675 [Variovorax sp. J22P271]|uniref:hypothetical protein n=1 Tax=Variovorax davisae TaxID=3053515 RepID=UPI00257613CA|nr:hypothetical protein [Variovorax sp. J22P271]MDM0032206.1 hypothetical protein [Variovorax sp. J22P271]